MTSSARVLGPLRPRQCCSLHFRMLISQSLLPRLAWAHLTLTQLPSLAGSPLATYCCSDLVWLRHLCWLCLLLCAPASTRLPLHWRAFAFLPDHPSSCGCSECSPIVILIRPLLPASVLQLSAPGRRSAVVDACLGLAWCPIDEFFLTFVPWYVQRWHPCWPHVQLFNKN